MGYFNSVGQWVDTPPNFQANGIMPQQPNGAWGGGNMMQNTLATVSSVVPINGGRTTVDNYPVAPGARVFLVDVNELVTYVKERDPQGRSTNVRIYDWTMREEPKPEQAATIDYEKIRSMIAKEVSAAMAGGHTKQKKETK